LLNVCFNTKIQRNYLWNQQKTQFHSSLRLNIEIFKNKMIILSENTQNFIAKTDIN